LTADELGPEMIIRVQDSKTGMRGILVVDSTVLGPAGGGARMLPDVSEEEVAALARGMTHKFSIFGFPRGGSKAGLVGDPSMEPDRKRAVLEAFGRALAPLLRDRDVAIGPDMGVSVDDVQAIYEGAATKNIRSGLFARPLDGDSAAYHLTGFGVVSAMTAALESLDRPLGGATVAIEGFGQVGVGTARYAVKRGLRVVAVTTLVGGVYEPGGLDVAQLLALRRVHGDACVKHYPGGRPIVPSDVYYLPVDVMVPGARPYVLNGLNAARVQARVVCPAGNIAVTQEAEHQLHTRGVICLPDFVANAGGAIASWVDILGGTLDQAFGCLDRLISRVSREVLLEAVQRGQAPGVVARARCRHTILTSPRRRPTFEESRVAIRKLLDLPG
jgi:glutamate dehydrogenase (NAD(P)+)